VDPDFPFSIELATFTNGVKNAHHGEKETRGGLAMY
jgi:hypothetical protein